MPHSPSSPSPSWHSAPLDCLAAEKWRHTVPTSSPWLHEEVAQRMLARLDWITLKPQTWLHWEPVRGGLKAHSALAQRFKSAPCYVVEATPARAKFAQTELNPTWWKPKNWGQQRLHFEPPPNNSVQMVWANMALHMCAEPQTLIAQWHAALAVDGYLMFSCLGPDTLQELRGVYAKLGWPAPSHAFTDMHDWGDLLLQAGFEQPVMDMERIVLTFSSPARLLKELRELGRNLNPQRFSQLRGRTWLGQLEQALLHNLAQKEGEEIVLPLTFEIIYGHAFKSAPVAPVASQTTVSLSNMRQILKTHQLKKDD